MVHGYHSTHSSIGRLPNNKCRGVRLVRPKPGQKQNYGKWNTVARHKPHRSVPFGERDPTPFTPFFSHFPLALSYPKPKGPAKNTDKIRQQSKNYSEKRRAIRL